MVTTPSSLLMIMMITMIAMMMMAQSSINRSINGSSCAARQSLEPTQRQCNHDDAVVLMVTMMMMWLDMDNVVYLNKQTTTATTKSETKINLQIHTRTHITTAAPCALGLCCKLQQQNAATSTDNLHIELIARK